MNSSNTDAKATSAVMDKTAVVKSPELQSAFAKVLADAQVPVHYTGKTAKGTAATSKPAKEKAVQVKDTKQEVVVPRKPSLFEARMEIVQDFPDLPYTLQALIVNGKDFGSQSVWEDQKHIADVRDGYVLMPNERVLPIAAQIAKEEGAVPFDQFKGEWFNKAEKNVIYGGRTGHQMHALFTWNEEFEVRKGDKIRLGFSIHNSIDGRMGLGGGFFTFRHACSNMFFMGFKAQGMSFDDRETLAHFYHKHTKEINKDQLRVLIKRMIATGKDIVAEIRALDERKLTLEKAKKLVDIIGVERAIECMPYVEIPSEDDKDGKMKLLDDTVTDYDAWNDVTYAITYAEDIGTTTKMAKFRGVEKVLVRPRSGPRAAARTFADASKKVAA